MKTNLQFDFSVDEQSKTIVVKREFSATVALVWDAFTKSELLDQWWAPKPWKAKTTTMNFTEGGKWVYVMVGPNGEEHGARVEYKTIQPQEYFIASDGFTDAAGNPNAEMPQSKWHVNFTAKEDHTLVETRMSFDTLEQLNAIIKMGFEEGYKIAGDGLDVLLEQWKK